MRVFITGGTGFIGKYTIQELKKRGHHLLVLSREPQREKDFDFLRGDMSDINKWKGRLKKFKPEAAIHLAWEGIPDFSYNLCAKNLRGGLAIFSLLADVGCQKVIVPGTGFEYDGRIGKVHETMSVSPANAFTSAKHALHLLGETLAKEKGMDFIWIRPFNPYGYGQRPASVIPYIIRCVSDKTPLRLRNPVAQGDFIYIADLAQLISKAVDRGRGIVTYNAGSGYLTPVRDIAKVIFEEMGATLEYCEDFARTARGRLSQAPYANIKSVHRGLNWRPLVSIRKGIRETIKNYENNRNWI